MTKKDAIISWLNWFKESIDKKIDIAESDVNDAEFNFKFSNFSK
jgi:hypothetical protein